LSEWVKLVYIDAHARNFPVSAGAAVDIVLVKDENVE
jgi:hypothetical protein